MQHFTTTASSVKQFHNVRNRLTST